MLYLKLYEEKYFELSRPLLKQTLQVGDALVSEKKISAFLKQLQISNIIKGEAASETFNHMVTLVPTPILC